MRRYPGLLDLVMTSNFDKIQLLSMLTTHGATRNGWWHWWGSVGGGGRSAMKFGVCCYAWSMTCRQCLHFLASHPDCVSIRVETSATNKLQTRLKSYKQPQGKNSFETRIQNKKHACWERLIQDLHINPLRRVTVTGIFFSPWFLSDINSVTQTFKKMRCYHAKSCVRLFLKVRHDRRLSRLLLVNDLLGWKLLRHCVRLFIFL